MNNGIEFFPINVDFFDDDKIALIEAEFGIKGSYVAIRLLCKIYSEGFFYKWGGDECLLFAKKMGAGFVPDLIDEIVNGLVKRGFLNKSVFNSFGILTSQGIQQRYFEAAKRRQKVVVNKDYLLIDVSKYSNVYILDENVNIDSENADIYEQSKVKYSKVKEKKRNPPQTPPMSSLSSNSEEEERNSSILEWIKKTLDEQFEKGNIVKSAVPEFMRLADSNQTKWVGYYIRKSLSEGYNLGGVMDLLHKAEEQKTLIPRFTHDQYFDLQFVRDLSEDDDYKEITSLICSESNIEPMFRTLHSAIDDCKSGKIKMPSKFIISKLKSKAK